MKDTVFAPQHPVATRWTLAQGAWMRGCVPGVQSWKRTVHLLSAGCAVPLLLAAPFPLWEPPLRRVLCLPDLEGRFWTKADRRKTSAASKHPLAEFLPGAVIKARLGSGADHSG